MATRESFFTKVSFKRIYLISVQPEARFYKEDYKANKNINHTNSSFNPMNHNNQQEIRKSESSIYIKKE